MVVDSPWKVRCQPSSKTQSLSVVVPAGDLGEDAAGEVEGAGLELEDGEVGEDVLVGIEELVVEDAGGLVVGGVLAGGGATRLTGHPFAIGAEEGLGGLAFDLGEKGFLAAVGGGEIGFVEDEEQGGEQESRRRAWERRCGRG